MKRKWCKMEKLEPCSEEFEQRFLCEQCPYKENSSAMNRDKMISLMADIHTLMEMPADELMQTFGLTRQELKRAEKTLSQQLKERK